MEEEGVRLKHYTTYLGTSETAMAKAWATFFPRDHGLVEVHGDKTVVFYCPKKADWDLFKGKWACPRIDKRPKDGTRVCPDCGTDYVLRVDN